jgi:hypothetical protein
MNDEKTEHHDPRMKLTIKDMPKMVGVNRCIVGETRNHFPDGHYESRFQPDGKKTGGDNG